MRKGNEKKFNVNKKKNERSRKLLLSYLISMNTITKYIPSSFMNLYIFINRRQITFIINEKILSDLHLLNKIGLFLKLR